MNSIELKHKDISNKYLQIRYSAINVKTLLNLNMFMILNGVLAKV